VGVASHNPGQEDCVHLDADRGTLPPSHPEGRRDNTAAPGGRPSGSFSGGNNPGKTIMVRLATGLTHENAGGIFIGNCNNRMDPGIQGRISSQAKDIRKDPKGTTKGYRNTGTSITAIYPECGKIAFTSPARNDAEAKKACNVPFTDRLHG